MTACADLVAVKRVIRWVDNGHGLALASSRGQNFFLRQRRVELSPVPRGDVLVRDVSVATLGANSMEHIGSSLANTLRNIEIVGADPVTRHGFTQVPNFILTEPNLTVGAKLTYAMLLSYAWHNDACFPGQQKLATDMGSGERSIRNYLNELETAGYLEVTQRGLGKTNLYRLFLVVTKKPVSKRSK